MSAAQERLDEYCRDVARNARAASRRLATASAAARNGALAALADLLASEQERVLAANRADLEAASDLSAALRDRLKLDPKRIAGMAAAVREIALARDPVGEVLEGSTRPNGLEVRKVRTPLGVVFFIYESRPNVTTDAAALETEGGGSEAAQSNAALGA
ncbi:MAG TPA: gamma-glutamyl-phosphate reductase, partial [Planctomycetia bacterium]|nr:gamma-glutamyl-phosphate reductase [Planctomycetia bacterium]